MKNVCMADLARARGQYHGGRRLSSDDSFHSPTVIPPSALNKPSIIKSYHHWQTMRWGVTALHRQGNALWYSVCQVPMVEWQLDCEKCRHLTVVCLHDTSPRSDAAVIWIWGDISLHPTMGLMHETLLKDCCSLTRNLEYKIMILVIMIITIITTMMIIIIITLQSALLNSIINSAHYELTPVSTLVGMTLHKNHYATAPTKYMYCKRKS